MATRWQGMGSKEASTYSTERKDYMDSSFKAGRKQGRDTLKDLIKWGLVKKGIDTWAKAGQENLLNETIQKTLSNQSNLNSITDKFNPYLSGLMALEKQQTAMTEEDLDFTNEEDVAAYYYAQATGDAGKEFKEMYALYPRGAEDLKIRKEKLKDYIKNITSPVIKAKAENKIKNFNEQRSLFSEYKDPASGMPFTSQKVMEKIQYLKQQIFLSSGENLAEGQYVNPDEMDGILYQMGFKDGDLRKNITEGVKDELIGESLKRRLDFKIKGTEVDEDFERMADIILTNWYANADKVSPKVKDKILESVAIVNDPNANVTTTAKDVKEANKTLDITTNVVTDYSEKIPDLSEYLIYKEDDKPLSKDEQANKIRMQVDKLGELQWKLDKNEIDFGTFIKDYNNIVYKEIGLYTLKNYFSTLNDKQQVLMKTNLWQQIKAQGLDSLDANESELLRIMYPTAFGRDGKLGGSNTGTKGDISVNTTSDVFITGLGAINTATINKLANQYTGSIPIDTALAGEAELLIRNRQSGGSFLDGIVTEANKDVWIAAKREFLMTEVTKNFYENQINIFKSSLASDESVGLQMAIHNSSVVQAYIDKGYKDLQDIRAMAEVDTYAAFFGVKGEVGLVFDAPDRLIQGIGQPRLGLGKDSVWAKMLNVQYTTIGTDANKRIDNGALTYKGLNKDERDKVEAIFQNFTDWENGQGKWGEGSKLLSSNEMQNKIERYSTLRKFADVLSIQPSKDSQLTNRVERAIKAADSLVTTGGDSYDQAYIQLRRVFDNELTMYNIAFGTRLQTGNAIVVKKEIDDSKELAEEIQQNLSGLEDNELRNSMIDQAIQLGADPELIDQTGEAERTFEPLIQEQVSNTDSSKLFGGFIEEPSFNSLEEVKEFVAKIDNTDYTFTEKDDEFIRNEITRLNSEEVEVEVEESVDDVDEKSTASKIIDAALLITTFGGPTAMGIKWAGKKAATKIPIAVTKALTTVGNNALKGKKLFNIKGKADAVILQSSTVKNLIAGKIPNSIGKIKDAKKKAIALKRWEDKQRKISIKALDPKTRLKAVKDSKWYKKLSQDEQATVDVMVKANTYKYGGKAVVSSREVGKELLTRYYGKEALRTGIKKYAPIAVPIVSGSLLAKKTIDESGDNLLMRRAFEQIPEEK